jgi:CubicO group peptidase (beta-lactamase class C family)
VLIRFLSVAVLMTFCAGGCIAAPTAKDAMRAVESRLGSPVLIVNRPLPHKRLIDEMQQHHVPGVSIAVVHGGKIQWAKAYGVRRQDGSPVTQGTLFQAASISKSVAAMAALSLVEKGKLSLDTPVNAQLKSWTIPESAFTATQPVTLRELLSHTGGTSVIGFGSYPRGATLPTLKQVLDGLPPANSPAVRVVATPGTEYRYSGGGYEIVEQLMEDATGKSFADLARETVFAPAAMENSNFEQPLSDAHLDQAAYPVDAKGSWIADSPPTLPELAAGGLWTTPSDLARWVIELQTALSGKTGHILSPAVAQMMITPVKENYGLGVEVKKVDGVVYFSHTGSNVGYQAMYVGTSHGDGAVVMTNSDNGFAVIAQIIPTLARIYDWPAFAPEKRKLADVPLAQLLPYTGDFATKDGYTFKVAAVGKHLEFTGLGHTGSKFLPSSARSFFVTDNSMQIFFETPDRGIMEIGGGKKPFDRTPASVP